MGTAKVKNCSANQYWYSSHSKYVILTRTLSVKQNFSEMMESAIKTQFKQKIYTLCANNQVYKVTLIK